MTKFEDIKQHGLSDEEWLEMAREMGQSRTTTEQQALALVLTRHYRTNYEATRVEIKKRRFDSLPEMWSAIAKAVNMTPNNLRNLAAAELTQRIADVLEVDVEELFEDPGSPIPPRKSERGKPN